MLTYDGATEGELARRLDLPRVVLYDTIPSTMDVAHALAHEGAPSGTLVLADAQTRGRGRGGTSWMSDSGAGVWMTLVERPSNLAAIEVLSLRIGLRAAHVLDRFAGQRVQIKWPNDLMLADGKVAGILVEARWREQRPEWVAIGVGINLAPPAEYLRGASLGAGHRRTDVLEELLPAMRAAARVVGPLVDSDLEAFASRDWARGRRAVAPCAGVVTGLSRHGALLIQTLDGTVACASGSLVLEGAET